MNMDKLENIKFGIALMSDGVSAFSSAQAILLRFTIQLELRQGLNWNMQRA